MVDSKKRSSDISSDGCYMDISPWLATTITLNVGYSGELGLKQNHISYYPKCD